MTPPGSSPQHLAADPGASVWVVASAGTGKTKVLTERVLRLLLAGTAPGHILCITFTKTAAAEMRNRIEETLSRWASAPEAALGRSLAQLLGHAPETATLSRARGLLATVLDAPSGLRIETIHAFCQSLLARFPIEARVAPHFQVADEREQADMLEAAKDAVLRAARGDGASPLAEALARVTALAAETTFDALMKELADSRRRLRALLRRHGSLERMLAALYERAGFAPGDRAETLREGACAEARIDGAGLERAAAALERGSETDGERAAAIRRWLAADPAGRAAGLDDYARAFLKKGRAPLKTLITKRAARADPFAETILAEEQERLATLFERLAALGVCDSTAALLAIGARLLANYESIKEARALLDYDDQILAARDLLQREDIAPWVLFKLDGGIDHILLDEAQDTSPEQWQIVAAFAEEFFVGESARAKERTLFVVGDEKQSIFSFQGAEPRNLALMREHFAARARAAQEPWREVPLDHSYRSVPAVLAAVDAVFAQPRAAAGVAMTEAPIRHRAIREGQAGRVELWPLIGPRAARAPREPWPLPLERRALESPRVRLARHIARTIGGWLEEGESLAALNRPVEARDIMILVPRRTSFIAEMVQALKGRSIAVAGVDRLVLSHEIAIEDLVALGQFLLLPDDDLTLAALLKSPLVGLEEDDLFALAHGRGEASLWQALGRRKNESQRMGLAHALLADFLAKADYAGPYELYADLLGRRGGWRRLLARLGPEAEDALDEFLNAALDYQRHHPPSLQGFLHWLGESAAEIKRDPEQGRDAVRIMTVHGAKGLQAPIVFLPEAGSLPPTEKSLILWPEDDGAGGLPLWAGGLARADEALKRAKNDQKERALAEYRRLLYVAMTRASERLYVAGVTPNGRVPEESWYALIRSGLESAPGIQTLAFDAGAGWQGETLRLESPQIAPPPAARIKPPPPEAAAPPAFALRPAPSEPPPPRLAPSRAGDEAPAVSPVGGGGALYHRGLHIHRLLELLPELAPAERETAARRYLAHPGRGLAPDEQAEIHRTVMNVLTAPGFAPLFAPGSRAEVALAGTLAGRRVVGRVDRLVVTGEAVLIVDYKTHRQAPAGVADIGSAELGQMALYRALLTQIFPEKTIRSMLLWTSSGVLMEVPEKSLEQALALISSRPHF